MATPGAPSPDGLSDAPPRPPGPQGLRGERGGARLAEPRIKAGRCRGLAESGEARWRFCHGCCRFCFSSSPPLRRPFWRSTPILPAPGLWPYRAFHVRIRATFAPLCGLASPRTCSRGRSWPDSSPWCSPPAARDRAPGTGAQGTLRPPGPHTGCAHSSGASRNAPGLQLPAEPRAATGPKCTCPSPQPCRPSLQAFKH